MGEDYRVKKIVIMETSPGHYEVLAESGVDVVDVADIISNALAGVMSRAVKQLRDIRGSETDIEDPFGIEVNTDYSADYTIDDLLDDSSEELEESELSLKKKEYKN